MNRNNLPAVAVAILALSTVGASAHTISWHAGMSRTIGVGHCAKGPCTKRSTFALSVPHRHLGGGVCIGMGAGGYRFNSRFPC